MAEGLQGRGGGCLINIQVNWASLLSAFELLSLLWPKTWAGPGPVPGPLLVNWQQKTLAQDMVMVVSYAKDTDINHIWAEPQKTHARHQDVVTQITLGRKIIKSPKKYIANFTENKYVSL